jgi:hypothetical protein
VTIIRNPLRIMPVGGSGWMGWGFTTCSYWQLEPHNCRALSSMSSSGETGTFDAYRGAFEAMVTSRNQVIPVDLLPGVRGPGAAS